MTTDPRLEPLLRSWLEERVSVPGPTGLAATLELLGNTPQSRPLGRRTWVSSHRLPHAAPISRQWRLVLLLLALALAMGALLVAGGTSPSPIDQLVRLTATTEEPGIERMTAHIGSEELAYRWAREVEVGADGAIWVLGRDGVLRVGAPGIHLGPASIRETLTERQDPTDLTAGPDGTVWLVSGWGQLDGYDGSGWTSFAPPDGGRVQAVEVDPNGTPWTMWTTLVAGADNQYLHRYAPTVARLDHDAWVALPTPIGPVTSLAAAGRYLAVTADGSAWVGVAAHQAVDQGLWRGLVRFDGEDWVVVRPIMADQDVQAGPLAAGTDGTLWAYFDACLADGVYVAPRKGDCSHAGEGSTHRHWLGRFDGAAWKVLADADGAPVLDGASLKVGAGGTLWMNGAPGMVDRSGDGSPEEPCPGVSSFDGTTWDRYLVGTCVNDLAIAPDGAVWASSAAASTDALYRIDPAAAP